MQAENKKKYTNFGCRFRFIRKKMGLSQSQLAEKLGFATYDVIGRFERGERLPSIQVVIMLSELCQMDLHWLLTGNPSLGSQAWKESYVEVARLATTYITWDNTYKEEKRRKLVHELLALREKQSTGEGVSEDTIVSLKEQIAAIEKRLSDNASAQHEILERVYGKKQSNLQLGTQIPT